MNYFVYMLRCADGTYYVGITNDLERRLGEHAIGHDRRSYTFKRRPVELVHSSDFHEVDDALRCEKHLKGWSHAKRSALIEGDWQKIRTFASRAKREA